ncbi:MAG: tRNA uracil 4-sulfurtransferase ThiI [Solirubrobacterales bacterium]
MDAILVRYGEIGLKGDNRGLFEAALIQNLSWVLRGTGAGVVRVEGRILIQPVPDPAEIIQRIRAVFGVVSLSPVRFAQPELESIQQTCEQLIEAAESTPRRFKVETRRADKRFPMPSPEVSRTVGGFLLDQFPHLSVDVHHPELVVTIEIRTKAVYVWSEVIPGPGGLPVGTSGKAMLLLSGGIDSPVAGWMAMKRGIRISAVHFHSFPYTGERSRLKVIELARILARFHRGLDLFIVNVAEIQETIVRECPEKLRVTLLRRQMLRIAEMLADKNGDLALITGESVGQVASQTLESMQAIGQAVSMVLIKPLACFDKSEITRLAEQIGTYETSIQPYEDCCTLFVPKHPATKPRLEQVLAAEQPVDWTRMVETAITQAERLRIEG